MLRKLVRDRKWKSLAKLLDSPDGRRQIKQQRQQHQHGSGAGADADGGSSGERQETPLLHLAVAHSAPLPILVRLLSLDPDALNYARPSDGLTPLHIAARVAAEGGHSPRGAGGAIEAVRLMLEIASACDEGWMERLVSQRDKRGRTALHLACRDPSATLDDEDEREREQDGDEHEDGVRSSEDRRWSAPDSSAAKYAAAHSRGDSSGKSSKGSKSGSKKKYAAAADEDLEHDLDYLARMISQDRNRQKNKRQIVELVYLLCQACPSAVNIDDDDELTPIEYALEAERGYEVVRLLRKASEAAWKGRSRETTNAALRRIVERKRSGKKKMAQAA